MRWQTFRVGLSPRWRLLLAVALLFAALVVPATRASESSRQPTAYAGLGTWVDIFATSTWAQPERAVTAMARHGVRTLYLQTGNYSQPSDLVRSRAVGRFVDAAHAAGLQVVAWYLPSLADPVQDRRRALAAIRFRTARGERFDSFALDIEASLVHPVWLRNERLLRLSAQLRAAVGPRYALGAITPGPVGLRRHPRYWPGFPYRQLARFYNAFLPMAYFTDAHIHGARRARRYLAADVAGIRARSGNPHVPIHLIGGIAGTMSAADTTGFMRAVADCSPVGFSLYEFPLTRRATWTALNTAPAASPSGACR
jgi:hypothetical protein